MALFSMFSPSPTPADRDGGNVLERLALPGSARHLALVRMLLGLNLLIVYSSGAIPLALDVGYGPGDQAQTWVPPIVELWAQWNFIRQACVIVQIGAVMMMVGFQTRLATWVTLAAFLLTQSHYYRQLYFHDSWPYYTVPLLILGLSRTADAWSLDAWLLQRLKWPLARSPLGPNVYRWPVEIIVVWWTILYVGAGVSKMMPLRKGWVWLNGDAVRFMIVDRYFDSPIYWTLGRPLFDYDQRWLFSLAAVATVIVEVGAIGVLFSRRLQLPIVLAVAGLHVGIYLFGVSGFLMASMSIAAAMLPPAWFGDRGWRPEPAR